MVPPRKRGWRESEYNFSNDKVGNGNPATSEYTLEIEVCHCAAQESSRGQIDPGLVQSGGKASLPKVPARAGDGAISAMSTVAASTIMAAE